MREAGALLIAELYLVAARRGWDLIALAAERHRTHTLSVVLAAAVLGGAGVSSTIIIRQRINAETTSLVLVGHETVIYQDAGWSKPNAVPARSDPLDSEQVKLFAHRYSENDASNFVPSAQMGEAWTDSERLPSGGRVYRAEAPVELDELVAFHPDIAGAKEPALTRKDSRSMTEKIDDYLWDVYQRVPIKRDGSGDFTWKDPAAAKQMGLSLQDYVIGGMDSGFREQLYRAGQAMDAAGLQWSMLSAFRDDYRQSLASGYKAAVGNSLHGGSRRTGGYGHGRAIDITAPEGKEGDVWKWIDAHGAQYGLQRPLPKRDPAHVEQRGEVHNIAVSVDERRLGTVAGENRRAAENVHKAALRKSAVAAAR